MSEPSNEPMDCSTPNNSSGAGETATVQSSVPVPSRRSVEGALHILGEDHETVLYHGDDVVVYKPPAKEEEEDEKFYDVEVTIDDVKSMFKDLQRHRESLEDAPFKGRQLRALEKEKAVLSSLHDYPNTAVRIRFPDRLILQGIFRTSDTISSVKSWLRLYLSDPELNFYLFTAPPRKVLEDNAKLVDEGLVAKVVVYFGSQQMPDRVLKQDIYERISDPEQAFELAKNKLQVRKREHDEQEAVKASSETQLKDHSEVNQPSSSRAAAPIRRTDKGKVPKWFKMK